MAALSPTQRTLRYIKGNGQLCDIVERFNPYAGKFGQRNDFMGFADIIALDCAVGIIAYQSCGQAFSDHKHKLLEERNEAVFEWIRCGGKVILIGWRKVKYKHGSKAMRWRPRIADITLENDELIFKERK